LNALGATFYFKTVRGWHYVALDKWHAAFAKKEWKELLDMNQEI